MPHIEPSLLLLPPPPAPVTSVSLSTAYRPTITAVISSLKLLPTSTKLMIVIPCPSVHESLQLPRSQIYDELQGLMAGLYSLVCIVCVELGAEVESTTPGSIDARILLLDYATSEHVEVEGDLDSSTAGPIVGLPLLAATRRRWNRIFSVDGEEGQRILATYTALSNTKTPSLAGQIQIVPGGVSLVRQTSYRSPRTSTTSHHVVAVGGTFDHLHAGHKLLLTATALLLQPITSGSEVKRRLVIGITGDELLKNKKYAQYLKSWKQRQDDVVEFLLSVLLFSKSPDGDIETKSMDEPVPNGRQIHTTLKSASITIECAQIQDPFGPTITDESISALVVSGETRSGGQAVNDRRKEKSWKALEVFEIDVLNGQDNGDDGVASNFASKISSSAIRQRKAELGTSSSL